MYLGGFKNTLEQFCSVSVAQLITNFNYQLQTILTLVPIWTQPKSLKFCFVYNTTRLPKAIKPRTQGSQSDTPAING